jgi:hypothetical protein
VYSVVKIYPKMLFYLRDRLLIYAIERVFIEPLAKLG